MSHGRHGGHSLPLAAEVARLSLLLLLATVSITVVLPVLLRLAAAAGR